MPKTTIEYNCKKRIKDPHEIERILTEFHEIFPYYGKEGVQLLYQMMGMEIDPDDIPL